MPTHKHVYTPIDTPARRRLHDIENLIQRWRSTGDLFLDDPNITAILKEYDDLRAQEDPTLAHPLSFHREDWDTPPPTPTEKDTPTT